MGEDFSQILVLGFEKSKGSVKVIGYSRDSPWYDSMEKMLDAIDCKLMEGWHKGERELKD